jgi:hypothetical protein
MRVLGQHKDKVIRTDNTSIEPDQRSLSDYL